MQLRQSNIDKLAEREFDVLVLGGGINGAVSAAALSGKGVKVALIDRGDFAGFTSQESSNLAWGGIKYMETFDFALVRKLCLSRNHLIRNYPSIVEEIRFFTSVPKGFRHSRMKLYAGTWLYWFFGNCFTRTPRLVSNEQIAQEEPILDRRQRPGGVRVLRRLPARQRLPFRLRLHPAGDEQRLHCRQLRRVRPEPKSPRTGCG